MTAMRERTGCSRRIQGASVNKLLPALAAGLFSCAAWAGLGGPPADLAAHAVAARSSTVTSGSATYTVSETTLDSGTVVRQYVDAGGTVFAVSWSGPSAPDLKELLGAHFDTLVAHAGARQGSQRSRLNLRRSDVVITTAGHMGALEGRAWVPSKLPAGFDPKGPRWPS